MLYTLLKALAIAIACTFFGVEVFLKVEVER